ncbi:MAG: hypothetical protein R3F14_09395 [Polyangiaceae bacterium]
MRAAILTWTEKQATTEKTLSKRRSAAPPPPKRKPKPKPKPDTDTDSPDRNCLSPYTPISQNQGAARIDPAPGPEWAMSRPRASR